MTLAAVHTTMMRFWCSGLYDARIDGVAIWLKSGIRRGVWVHLSDNTKGRLFGLLVLLIASIASGQSSIWASAHEFQLVDALVLHHHECQL